MIREVHFDKTTYADIPHRFEAGTPSIAGACGLAAALDYLTSFDPEALAAYEQQLLAYATDALTAVPGLRLIGTAPEKVSVLSFVLDGVHPHDVGTIFDQHNVAVRAGHHCAQPVMEFFGIPATVRASLALYNTQDDVDALVEAIRATQELFA
jgi:cysteine desulfurase/selenocysteine lyase